MRGKILTITLAVLLGAGLASIQALTQQQQPPALTMDKVKDDLYEIVGDGGNVAVLVTNEGVLLIDDKFQQDHDQITAKVKSITSQPIKYVINTHYHEDHSGGNGRMLMLPGIEIISTANSRKNILEHKQSNASPNVVPARMTFTEEQSVFIGGKEVRARYFGRGHTNGDAVIYFPADRTIHTGDLMAGTSPLIDYNGGGSLIEWTKTLDAVMAQLDFDTVIPGHGNVTNKAGLMTYRNNVEKLRNRVTGLIREGKKQEDIAKVMADEYGWQPNSLQQQWSVPGFMKEFK
jgi:cyclase